MIRKIRENSAASQIQQRMLQAAQQAQLAQHFQQQNLQAVYERALKVRESIFWMFFFISQFDLVSIVTER